MAGSYADILKKKEREWNCSDLMTGHKTVSTAKIPFSSPLMNYATYGGIPRNKITEFFGEPGSGKTTTAVDICKRAAVIFKQEFDEKVAELRDKVAKGNKALKIELDELLERGPKKVFYADLEHSFDKAWAATLQISEDEIDIMTPPDIPAEDFLNTLLELIETGAIGLAVIDSVPSLVPKAELDKKLGERTVASLAGLLCTFFRKVVPMLTRYECTLLTINQIRDNMDNPYVVNTPGGRAPKFYSCLRMHFRIGTPVDFLGNELPSSAENPAGYIINAKIVKQKSAPFDRKLGSYYLMCSSGIRADFDFAQLATKKYGIIKKAGAWFTICDPQTGEVLEDGNGNLVKLNGMAKVYAYLQENPEYYNKLTKYILDDINGVEPDDSEDYESNEEDESEDGVLNV